MAKKSTDEEFVFKSIKKHGDKYDYSKVEYVNSTTKVCIICPIHGEFWQKPNNHLNGQGCPKCGRDSISHKLRYNKAYGVGINDYEGRVFDNRLTHKCYRTWLGMLERCYSKRLKKKYKTYTDCKSCDEWIYFTKFKEWFDKNYKEGYQLDKDILVQGNKTYSPETCCFVPQYINKLLLSGNSQRDKYKRGVCFRKDINKFIPFINLNGKITYLGCFNTENEAFETYKKAKCEHIKEVATKALSNGDIDKRVYDALIAYKIE